MDKKAYNLKRTFEQPIVMYEFTDGLKINKGLRVDFWITFIVIWIVFLLAFLSLLKPLIMSISGLMFIYFTVAPYYLTKYVVKLKQDGKKLFFFLWDFILYILNVQMKHVKYSFDEEVHYQNKKITFK
ncbi:conjugal transfer protein [Staphylococcus agnetis]|uniref:conjugal transfer protein n=1 Tax=Staphylococcus agnetis TaxID=985762 RepID=UPI0021D1240D|nr:conjugal transfer protein [Staphylococcus agnetis]UXU60239.1 conjugal transfer protein [Staphylococcus agnetis]UXU62570.1 conjugal transfer protein [Staphylococcus agnetis]UXU65162.1 conjugal transfer protein [Staphylococcus agnetis]